MFCVGRPLLQSEAYRPKAQAELAEGTTLVRGQVLYTGTRRNLRVKGGSLSSWQPFFDAHLPMAMSELTLSEPKNTVARYIGGYSTCRARSLRLLWVFVQQGLGSRTASIDLPPFRFLVKCSSSFSQGSQKVPTWYVGRAIILKKPISPKSGPDLLSGQHGAPHRALRVQLLWRWDGWDVFQRSA